MSNVNKNIVKIISAFTGVKMLNILCTLVRNKLMAVVVGPAGMGLALIYNSVLEMIGNTSQLNLDQSAVREVTSGNSARHRADVVTIVRRWTLWLGMVGMIAVCLLSPALSYWSFGDTDKWWTFCLLSPIPLFTALNGGRQSLLQGLGYLKTLAKASATGIAVATAVAVVLILTLGINSIIPIIFTYGACTLASTILFTPRLASTRMSAREVWQRGRGMVRLGALITASYLVSQAANYIFILYLKNTGNLDTVGLYQSGYALVATYVGTLLVGVWVEYFPRVGRASHSRHSTSVIVSNQIGLTVTLCLPLVLLFIGLDRVVVQLLYAPEFEAVIPYITIAIVGVILRVFSFCVSFVMVARGDGRAYIVTESISGFIGMTLNILGYRYGGMAGLGISYIAWYIIYCTIGWVVYHYRYRLTISHGLIAMTLGYTAIGLVAVIAKYYIGWWVPVVMAVASLPLSIKRIKK